MKHKYEKEYCNPHKHFIMSMHIELSWSQKGTTVF